MAELPASHDPPENARCHARPPAASSFTTQAAGQAEPVPLGVAQGAVDEPAEREHLRLGVDLLQLAFENVLDDGGLALFFEQVEQLESVRLARELARGINLLDPPASGLVGLLQGAGIAGRVLLKGRQHEGAGFGLPEISPYVTKTEVQLKMAALPYRKLKGARELLKIPIESDGVQIGPMPSREEVLVESQENKNQ